MNFDSPEFRDRDKVRKINADQAEMMRKYGWFAHYVPNDPDSPTDFNAHTHGFEESWAHPDVQIVIAMPQPQLHGILITIAELLKKGIRLEAGEISESVLEGYPVTFAWAKEGRRRLLRVILPDKDGGVKRDEIKAPYSIQWEGTEE